MAGAAYVVLLVGFALSRSLPLSALLLVMVGASDGVWSVTRNIGRHPAQGDHRSPKVIKMLIGVRMSIYG